MTMSLNDHRATRLLDCRRASWAMLAVLSRVPSGVLPLVTINLKMLTFTLLVKKIRWSPPVSLPTVSKLELGPLSVMLDVMSGSAPVRLIVPVTEKLIVSLWPYPPKTFAS